MAQNITLLGASYSDVPSVELPKTGGGTAQFDDTTIASNAASASDITSGKLAFVNGELVTGTASGGGGGLEYETGTWTPAQDIASYTIPFAKTHTVAPFFYLICDVTNTYSSTTSSNFCVVYYNYEQALGAEVYSSSTSKRYAEAKTIHRGTSETSLASTSATIEYPYTTQKASSSAYPRFWAKETGIKASTNSGSRYWRSGRTYKWIAVWAPTS